MPSGCPNPLRPRRDRLTITLLVSAIVALIISIILPSLQRYRMTAGRVPCGSNLRQIGQALLLYSMDNGGRLPASLADLAAGVDLSGEVFVCPDSDDRPVKGKHGAELTAELRRPGRISYLFLFPGEGLDQLDVQDLLVYEPPTYNEGRGSNALFADGHVEFLNAGELPAVLAATKARAATRPSTTQCAQVATKSSSRAVPATDRGVLKKGGKSPPRPE